MESPVNVTVEIDAEFDVGSPPDDSTEPYMVANPQLMTMSSTWMSKEGPNDGIVTSATTAFYPPFEDDDSRTCFGLIQFASGSGTIAWNGGTVYPDRLWVNTDPNWATAVTTSGLLEGAWFAVEGELESEYRVWRRGTDVDATL